MQFCKNCNNYLYITEDRELKKLYNYCKKCDYKKETNNTCIYKIRYDKNIEIEPYINHKYINDDPTYPTKNIECPECKKKNNNAFYQCNDLSIIFVCKKCKHKWGI